MGRGILVHPAVTTRHRKVLMIVGAPATDGRTLLPNKTIVRALFFLAATGTVGVCES